MSLMDTQTLAALLNPVTGIPGRPQMMKDKFGRTITDLRVSITDRCNYKCVYCRTGTEGAQFAELAMKG
jgi:GTP 3',8-cyclase